MLGVAWMYIRPQYANFSYVVTQLILKSLLYVVQGSNTNLVVASAIVNLEHKIIRWWLLLSWTQLWQKHLHLWGRGLRNCYTLVLWGTNQNVYNLFSFYTERKNRRSCSGWKVQRETAGKIVSRSQKLLLIYSLVSLWYISLVPNKYK